MISVGLAISFAIVSMVLLITTQILGNFDSNTNCANLTSTQAQNTCTTQKNNIWSSQNIFSYGLMIAAIASFVGGKAFGF